MFELVFTIILGILAGFLVGFSPVLVPTIAILSLWSLLHNLEWQNLLLFYLIMTQTSQFASRSITLFTGVPGEVTAAPLVSERTNILSLNHLSSAIKFTGIASAIGALFSLVLLIALAPFMDFFRYFLTTFTVLVLCVVVIGICLFYESNKIYVNLILIASGLSVGIVGYSTYFQNQILSFGSQFLYSGLPFIPIFLGIYAMPEILWGFRNKVVFSKSQILYTSTLEKFRLSHTIKAIKYSILGFVSGLIPYVGTLISSSTAYSLEKKSRSSDVFGKIVASESANNSAMTSVMIPLLIFGVAIVPSEALLLEILWNKNWTSLIVTSETILFLCGVMIVLIPIIYYMSTNLAYFFVSIFCRFQKQVLIASCGLCIFTVWNLGSLAFLEWYYIMVFLVSVVFGIFLKYSNINSLPMVFSYLVSETFLENAHRFFVLYF